MPGIIWAQTFLASKISYFLFEDGTLANGYTYTARRAEDNELVRAGYNQVTVMCRCEDKRACPHFIELQRGLVFLTWGPYAR